MQKQAPSVGRILIAVGFTLSCFGLILFLWIAFGGPVPLKPQSYRITAYFPEAIYAGPGVRRADRRRLGGQGQGAQPGPGRRPRRRQRHDRGRDRDRAAVRADLQRRQGDPAPEDAARRDLHRADARHRAGRGGRPGCPGRRHERLGRRGGEDRVARGGRDPRHLPDPGLDPDRRDLQRPRHRDPDVVPELARQQRDRDRGPRARPQRLARQPRARSSPTPTTSSRSSTARRPRSRASSATPAPCSRR